MPTLISYHFFIQVLKQALHWNRALTSDVDGVRSLNTPVNPHCQFINPPSSCGQTAQVASRAAVCKVTSFRFRMVAEESVVSSRGE